jgi:xanthine/CO dehydrogenase XdhC/CoxF family maturation factor
MKEIKAIIAAYDKIDQTQTRAALAIVVRVEGSSYRRTGARMLVLDNGTWIGGISGGCLEGDALKRARLAINKSEASLITYDTSEDDPHQIGVGLGCNGIIDVLFCPINFNDPNNPIEILKKCLKANRETHTLITITDLKGEYHGIKKGNCFQYNGGESLKEFENLKTQQSVNQVIKSQITTQKSGISSIELENENSISLFIELLAPETHVVLMGNQYDVFPMCRLLKEIGWRISIVANPLKLNSKIVALADEVKSPAEFQNMLIDEHTAIILMSHDFKTDKINLPRALNTVSPYIGMLGPKVRAQKIWDELAEEGFSIHEADMKRIYAPLGLDIGALTPEEIALSMAAGIRAAFTGRDGTFLKYRKTPIHPRN